MPLVVQGHDGDLARGRRPLLRRWGEPQVVQDALDGELVGDERDEGHPAATAGVLRPILLYLTDRRFEEGGLVVVTR